MVNHMTRYRVFLLLVFCIAFAGCERTFDSKEPVESLPNRPATPINLEVQYNDRSLNLSWEQSDSSGVSSFRIYRANPTPDSTVGTFVFVDSTTDYTKTLDNLPYGRTIYLRVTAMANSGMESEPSVALPVVPGLLSITVNSNDEYTNSRHVQIQLSQPGHAAYVRLSEDSLFADAAVQGFSPQLPFTLSEIDGSKMVYAHLTFNDGSESGDLFSDEIILDRVAQIDSVYYSPAGAALSPGDTVLFFVSAGGEIGGTAYVSFPDVNQIRLFDDGADADAFADDGLYSFRYIIPTGLTVNNGQLTGRFRDAAGNLATEAISSVPLDIKAPPFPVQLASVEALSSFEIRLNWSEAVSGDFAYYSIYRDVSATVSENSTLVETVSQRFQTTLVDTSLTGGSEYFYSVYVIDNSGLRSGSNVDSATTMTNTPPSAVTAAAALLDSATARLTWTQNNDHDFASYRIYRDTSPNVTITDDLITIISSRSTSSYDDYVPFPSGSETYYYRIYVFDRQNLNTSSNEVMVTH